MSKKLIVATKFVVCRERKIDVFDKNKLVEFQKIVNDLFNLIIQQNKNDVVKISICLFVVSKTLLVRVVITLECQIEFMKIKVSLFEIFLT